MENIDLVFILQPLFATIITFIMVIHYREKNTFTGWIFLYSLLAFGIAIAAKYAIQIPTINYITATDNLVYLGLYYGLQTVFLEVGLAYLFARLAFSKQQLALPQASAYGAGLAFWENGILLGFLPLISLATEYAIISSGGSSGQAVYAAVLASEPGLFDTPLAAFPGVFWGTLERVSSIIGHFAWGYLCVVAACSKQRKYFYVALPMGFLDFLVPFASEIPIYVFELIVFAWTLISLVVAKLITKNVNLMTQALPQQRAPTSELPA